ncbi:NHLP bacteriocin system secretion protein [Parasphingopyxis marina]|uniref:NHLP bacteriocin system secretion protein n=1 Tax=Parasphingopyxis marina TaxID=2761622 RepID=A0A842HZY3_9SPHN|nr:NHLP bacteriocin system secretion protein [Parasphingopyxis marina]MBC2777064.1 NHLP bacteriocin system secretion protein [Parasphingopyxis marina]
MARQIFRQEAIDSMASPDRLDQPLQLVRPANWIFLAIVGAVILFALVWGFTARVPVQVEARGILISAEGLAEVSAQYEGRVEEILVSPGDTVEAGDVVARLSRRSREREIRAAEAALRDAMAQAAAAESTYRTGDAGLSAAERAMLASLRSRTAEVRRLLETRDETVANMRGLVEQNAATEEELASIIASRDELRAELRRLEQERMQLGVTTAQRRNERGEERLGESQLVAQRRRELAQLRAQTDDEVLLRAPQRGDVLEIQANAGDVIAAGETVATIDSRNSGAESADSYEAVLYARPATGKRIAPGMTVEIIPTTAEREIYGHIHGEVVSTAVFPASREAMRRVLQNDRLVDELSVEGAPIEVRVRLHRAEQSGQFLWSSSDGPAWAITRGTMLEANVILERRPFIAVLFPGLAGSGERVTE